MTAKDRLADLFLRYAELIRTGTENQALAIRKLIQATVEREDKK
jgi:hypothetical protein